MDKRFALAVMLLIVSTPVVAQGPNSPVAKEPAVELFGGYAYAHFNAGGNGVNGNGVLGSFGWNAKPWLQIVLDTSYNRGSASGTKTVLYGNHYGVRFFYRERNKWRASPFVEALVGGSHVNNTIAGMSGIQLTDTGFSMKAGGGVDINLSPHFAIRMFDVNYYRTSFFGAQQNNFWLSTGFVLRLGGARPQ
jgi:hypothetical protein